ncbi:Phospholipase D1 [Umbelopsis sp. WA50703]
MKDLSGRVKSKSKRPQLNTRDLTFWDSDLNSEDMDTTSISDLRKTKSTSPSRRKKSVGRSEKRNSTVSPSAKSPIAEKDHAEQNGDAGQRSAEDAQPSSSSSLPEQQESMQNPAQPSGREPSKAGQATRKGVSKWGALRNTILFQSQLAGKQRANTEALREAKQHRTGADVVTENFLNIQPAMLVGMAMQRDEHNIKRIPVILSQLKIRITDSEEPFNRSKASFRIELEYGDGLMKWVIHRQYRDFLNLHYSYRRYDPTRTRIKGLPKFPKHSLPYFINYREDDTDSLSSDDDDQDYHSADDGENGVAMRNLSKNQNGQSRRPDISHHSTSFFSFRSNRSNHSNRDQAAQQAKFAMEQRRSLEQYLMQLARCLMLRGEANRLCKFFEISALGIQLSAEGGYHGKEGYMLIERRSDQNPSAHRAAVCGIHVQNIRKRLTPKWFLARHSFIACVEEPNSTIIYDVLLVDSDFDVERHHKHASTIRVQNSQRVMHLRCKNDAQAAQFLASLKELQTRCIWSTPNQRFDSFAPIRYNCSAQWIVDGRNYFWNVAKAIANAKSEIYIHDWWLSAELYMKRPAAHNFKWRLDRLLQRKAKQGVKIFIVMYKEVSITLPLYSHYAKEHLLSMSPNIYVMRHPSHLGIAGKTATFFWAHHEKICVIDNYIAFVGGIDLCFGRWDTPGHVLVDERDAKLDKNVDNPQIWHGKDYSNPRILDFHTLDKPEEDNMDRSKIPRMPWHDISMQVVGQPARDVARHFVQRWNFLRAKKAPKRPTPYLLPKPDFTPYELEKFNFKGTCQVQLLRSSSSWSIGYRVKIEHSIHDAYVKSIEESDHFVYIENQFFVTSTVVGTTVIENKIGDALVQRILKAVQDGQKWRAIIIIPLVPGFQNNVDEPEGMSIRMIMNCQFRSICRGENSIYGRLRARNINPDDYITFYGLRNWGRLGGEFVTEQVYIHAKTMIVDDRIAIIGSANINERSQRGSRDSEVAAYVKDSKMIDSHMAGKPYKVGHFAHTLRLRLMREHLGVDVDALEVEQIKNGDIEYYQFEKEYDWMDDDSDSDADSDSPQAQRDRELHDMGELKRDRTGDSFSKEKRGDNERLDEDWPQVPQEGDWDEGEAQASNEKTAAQQEHMEKDKFASGAGKRVGPAHDTGDVASNADDSVVSDREKEHVRVVPTSEPSHLASSTVNGQASVISPSPLSPTSSNATAAGLTSHFGDDSTNIISPVQSNPSVKSSPDTRQPSDKEKEEKFWKSIQWDDPSTDSLPSLNNELFNDPLHDDFFIHLWQLTANHNTDCYRRVFLAVPDDNVTTWARYKEFKDMTEKGLMGQRDISDLQGSQHTADVSEGGDTQAGKIDPRGKVLIETTGKSDEQVKQQVQRVDHVLAEIRGNLVIWPTKFMEAEDERNDFLFNTDKLAPIDIFD